MRLDKSIHQKSKILFSKVMIFFNSVYAFIRSKSNRLFRIINWFLAIKNRSIDKRVIVIFDLSSQPFNIGDFILIQEVALVLCNKYKTNFADIAIIHDTKLPASSKEFTSISEDNILYHLASILPVAQINQNLGSIFIFNSHKQFDIHVLTNKNNYIVWPSLIRYVTKDYLYYLALNKQILPFFKQNKTIPFFKCRDFLNTWAQNFYSNNLEFEIPVTINLRKNELFGTHRNSDMDAWLKFFENCIGKYNAKFIIIGSKGEVDVRMRNLKNVIIAKDFNTGIEQDLALVNTSAFHMGASSGPISMAWFCGKPYLMFSWDGHIDEYDDLVREPNDFYRFGFSSELQKMTKKRETPDLLDKEFKNIWLKLNLNNYSREVLKDKNNINITWLR
jgi:hypothetical protein